MLQSKGILDNYKQQEDAHMLTLYPENKLKP